MSDLIRKQVEHFKHLEEKLAPEVRAMLPQHRIVSEDDAARYIAPFTRLLRTGSAATPAAKTPIPMPRRVPAKKKEKPLDLAAAAAPRSAKKSGRGKRTR